MAASYPWQREVEVHGRVRVLADADTAEVLAVLARDPVANVFTAARVNAAGCDPWRLGAEIWGWYPDDALEAVCYSGANLVPAAADDPAAQIAFADRARRQGRRCSSIVGPAHMVLPMWHALEPAWGQPRDVRDDQPLMVLDSPPLLPADPAVRQVRADELDALLPACIAMFTEEVGISPTAADGGALYRSRVMELVAMGRSFARIENGRVLFKAEVGACAGDVCQIQGVYVDPGHRGQGLSLGGMAAVAALCRREIAPVVSLYVNDYNVPARRAYESVGFRRTGTFASILF